MIRKALVLWPLLLVLSACSLAPGEPVAPTPTATAVPAPSATFPSSPTAPVPTASPPPTATPELPPTGTAPPAATDLSLTVDDIFAYPVPEIYSGDTVTFYLLPSVPAALNPADVAVQIAVADQLVVEKNLNGPNLGGDAFGLFDWVWQTQGVVGDFQVTVTLDPQDTIQVGDENPDNNQVTFTLPVRPTSSRPVRERNAAWVSAETTCCTVYVVNGTAASRDLNNLRVTVDDAFQQAGARLDVKPEEKLDVFFIDRVLGQGGYAGSSSMVVSYLDRNYAGGGLYEVLVHEAVHLLDRQFAPNRISFLAEGLAVWAVGGHYKQEDIDQRIKALLVTDLYVPLPTLIDNFYPEQHEVGYVQAGGFLNYLVTTYGWERVRAFYSAVTAQEGLSLSQVVDAQLQIHFGRNLAQVEADWMRYLEALPLDEEAIADLVTTVRYYNLMRDYQLAYDPTAHFLQAWLPFPNELVQRKLTAEVNRHPESTLNITFEVMFHAADRAVFAGDLERANVILDSVERGLANQGVFIDPLGANYYRIVSKLVGLGFEVYQVDLRGNRATAQVTEGTRVYLRPVSMVLNNEAWILLN